MSDPSTSHPRDPGRRPSTWRNVLVAGLIALVPAGAGIEAQTEPVPTRTDFAFEESGRGHITGAFQKGELGLLFDSNKRRDGTTVALRDLQQHELLTVEIDERTGETELTILGTNVLALTDPLVTTDDQERAAATLADNASYRLLPELSRALGRAGRTGKDHPATMPIHMLAIGMARYLASMVPIPLTESDECDETEVVYRWSGDWIRPRTLSFEGIMVVEDTFCLTPPAPTAPPEIIEAWRSVCEPPCPMPNPEDDCFGMCGPGCDCWPWVCGDCCFHDICAEHDELWGDCKNSGDVGACVFSVPAALFTFVDLGC